MSATLMHSIKQHPRTIRRSMAADLIRPSLWLYRTTLTTANQVTSPPLHTQRGYLSADSAVLVSLSQANRLLSARTEKQAFFGTRTKRVGVHPSGEKPPLPAERCSSSQAARLVSLSQSSGLLYPTDLTASLAISGTAAVVGYLRGAGVLSVETPGMAEGIPLIHSGSSE